MVWILLILLYMQKVSSFIGKEMANYLLKHFLMEKHITGLVKVFLRRYLLLNEGSYTM